MPDRLYLDHNATSPIRPAVRDAMMGVLSGAHNPSSVHGEGRAAKSLLEGARKSLGDGMSVTKEGVIFTSGGTEAAHLAIHGLARGEANIARLFVGATEHAAVREAACSAGLPVETVPVRPDGALDLEWLERRLSSYDPDVEGRFVLCVMLANNETGVVHPISVIGPMIWAKGGYLFVDAVQGFGKLPIDFFASGADLMAIGAHKVGGPVGVGALLTKPGIPVAPLFRGGGQESYRRAGTENLAGIVGMAAALSDCDPSAYAELAVMRDKIASGLPDSVKVWGQGASRLANTICFSAPGFSSETQVMVLDLAGIAISAGSACSSGKVRASGVLTAMGATEDETMSAVRVSLGWDTPDDAAEQFLRVWTKEYERVAAKAA